MSFNLKDPGYVFFLVNLNKTQSREEATKVLIEEVEQLGRKPITAEELARAKTSLLNEFDKALSDPVRFGVSLSESIAIGDWRLYFLRRDLIEKASLADVQKAAQNYLVASNRTLGHYVPTEAPVRASIPPAPDLNVLLDGYKGKAALAQGEVFDPTPANINQRTQRMILPNGMKLALLPKSNRGQTVKGQIVLRMGSASSLAGKTELANAVAQMLVRGAAGLSRQQIADQLDALQSQLSIDTDNGNAVVVDFESRRDKLPALMGLIRQVLRQPSFPADEFESLRNEWLTSVDEARRQPQALAQKQLRRTLSPYPRGDVRYVPTFDETVQAVRALRLEDLRQFHAQFYGAQFGQAAVIGDFDAAQAQSILGELLGNWNSPAAYERVASTYQAVAGTQLTLETPDKANAVYLAALTLPMRDDHPDAQALVLANRVLGGGGLKNRLVDRLRQADGISYGSGSSLQLGSWDANASFSIYAIFAPQNLGKLRAGVSEELARWVAQGVTEQELSEAKSGLLQSRQINRSDDRALAGGWVHLMHHGRDMAHVQAQEDQLKAVTRAQVQQAIVRHLDPARLVQVFAGDFAKAANKAADKAAGKP